MPLLWDSILWKRKSKKDPNQTHSFPQNHLKGPARDGTRKKVMRQVKTRRLFMVHWCSQETARSLKASTYFYSTIIELWRSTSWKWFWLWIAFCLPHESAKHRSNELSEWIKNGFIGSSSIWANGPEAPFLKVSALGGVLTPFSTSVVSIPRLISSDSETKWEQDLYVGGSWQTLSSLSWQRVESHRGWGYSAWDHLPSPSLGTVWTVREFTATDTTLEHRACSSLSGTFLHLIKECLRTHTLVILMA